MGKESMEAVPASIIIMATTHENTGLSMKNRANITHFLPDFSLSVLPLCHLRSALRRSQ